MALSECLQPLTMLYQDLVASRLGVGRHPVLGLGARDAAMCSLPRPARASS